MNKTSFIHICRFILVLLLVFAPFKAFGGSSTTHYAKVTVGISDDSTGEGKVWVGNNEENKSLGSSGTSASITFNLHAEAEEGSNFVRWTYNQAGTEVASTSSDFNATVTAESTTSDSPTTVNYYAVFVKQTKYYAGLSVVADSRNTGTGTVYINDDPVSYAEAVSEYADLDASAPVTFRLKAVPDEGSKFAGWSEADGTGTLVSANPYTYSVTSTSADSSNPTRKTVYAVFVKNPSITIKINGSNFGLNDNVVFVVSKTDSPTETYTVPLKISASNQVVLKDVTPGTYSVTANGWAWNYNVTPTSGYTGVSVLADTEFTFTVSGKGTAKEYDEKSKVNWAN